MNFDPDSYTITIRKENVDGDLLYVGRVAEFQNITAYEETFEEARAILLDAISTLKTMADEEGSEFPLPNPAISEEYSGRPSLRLPKTLHVKVAGLAEQEGVSLNTFLVTAISTYIGQCDGVARMVREGTQLMIILVQRSALQIRPSGTTVLNTNYIPSQALIPSGIYHMEGR